MDKSIYKAKNNNINMSNIARIFAIFEKINGRKLEMNKYDDRLNLQKLTYILQKAGLNFGYRFTWYVKGPYSPPLASDAFDYEERGIKENIELSQTEQKIAENLKNKFGDGVTNPDKLELYASLLFLSSTESISLSDEERLSERLVSLKPWFEKEQAKQAIRKLRDSGLFSK